MSMPSLALRVSFLLHSCLPVEACSAKADFAVAPNTTPSPTVTPFGPTLVELYLCVQSTLPLPTSIAWTLDSRSCVYITPPTTTGDATYAPNEPAALIGTVHATPSVEALEA